MLSSDLKPIKRKVERNSDVTWGLPGKKTAFLGTPQATSDWVRAMASMNPSWDFHDLLRHLQPWQTEEEYICCQYIANGFGWVKVFQAVSRPGETPALTIKGANIPAGPYPVRPNMEWMPDPTGVRWTARERSNYLTTMMQAPNGLCRDDLEVACKHVAVLISDMHKTIDTLSVALRGRIEDAFRTEEILDKAGVPAL